jgi:hypothetical protein
MQSALRALALDGEAMIKKDPCHKHQADSCGIIVGFNRNNNQSIRAVQESEKAHKFLQISTTKLALA